MEPGFIAAAFGAGLLSFFSPCILPLLPVYIGLLTTDADVELTMGRRVTNTFAFVLGISTTFFILGLGAGQIGQILNNSYVAIVCGLLVFTFGLYLAGVLKIPALAREKRFDSSKINASTVIGAYLLGLAFSFGWTPCVGPILGAILAMAAQAGNALAGAGLTLVYSLGMSIPFVVITLASGFFLSKVRKINRYLPIIQRIGGILIAIMGLWMIFMQVGTMTPQHSVNKTTQNTAQEQTQETESATIQNDDWYNTKFPAADGQSHALADYKGKPVYIKVWATWCGPCTSNIGEFNEFANKTNEEGNVQVISVTFPENFNELDEGNLAAWLKQRNLTFPVLFDPNLVLQQKFGVSAFPTSVFIDADGNVVDVQVGAIEPDQLQKMFEEKF